VLAHRLFVAQIVILFDQAIEQGFLRRSPHLFDQERPQLAQTATHRPVICYYRFGSRLFPWRMAAYRRQFDLAGAFQHQQQTAADHIA
jgi:hypothetical protein